MAKVTGLTAERMLEIEAASVVDGEVVGDSLVLTKHDGTQIDAGNVRGPQGDTTPGTVEPEGDTAVIRTTDGRVKAGTPSEDDDAATKLYVDTESASQKLYVDTESASQKLYVDTIVSGIEITDGVDLNTLLTPGIYTRSSSAGTSALLNYPRNIAGMLEVSSNLNSGTGNPGNMVWQTYSPYGGSNFQFFKRGLYNGSWYGWSVFVEDIDTGWIGLTDAGFSSGTGATLISGSARRRNGSVSLYANLDAKEARSSGNITNLVLIQTSLSDWIPSIANGSFGPGSTGLSFDAYINTDGVIAMSNVNNGSFPVGYRLTLSGSYLI